MKAFYLCAFSLISLNLIGQNEPEADSFFYGGLKLGVSDYREAFDCDDCDPGEALFSDLSDRGFTFGLMGGYRFNRYLSVELAAQNFGKASAISFPEEGLEVEAEVDGVNLGLQGSLPLTSRVNLFAKGGWHFYDLSAQTFLEIDGITETEKQSWSEDDLFYGLGASFKLSPRFDLQVAWENYQMTVPDDDGDFEFDLGLYSVSLTYRF